MLGLWTEPAYKSCFLAAFPLSATVAGCFVFLSRAQQAGRMREALNLPLSLVWAFPPPVTAGHFSFSDGAGPMPVLGFELACAPWVGLLAPQSRLDSSPSLVAQITPVFLTPFFLTPVFLTPFFLTPFFLTPFFLTPFFLTPVLLRRFQASPIRCFFVDLRWFCF